MRTYRGYLAAGLTAAAVVYGVAFLSLAALNLPPLGMLIAVQPLLISLLMWQLLRERCTTGNRTATSASRVIAFLYLPWSVIGTVTLALGALPAAVLLAAATILTPAPARATAAA